MTKREVKEVLFNELSDLLKASDIYEPGSQMVDSLSDQAFTLIDFVGELNLLNDDQIAKIKHEIVNGMYYD